MEKVILVNKFDQEIGQMEKLEAHQKGLLHRAFSVLIFNNENELLIHQRADSKYHSPGLWTNACCSHPRPGEKNIDAAQRRLKEELGVSVKVEELFSFIYKADFDNHLTEFEFDHVLVGKYNGDLIPNPEEVKSWKYISFLELKNDISIQPENYTVWFKLIIEKYSEFKYRD